MSAGAAKLAVLISVISTNEEHDLIATLHEAADSVISFAPALVSVPHSELLRSGLDDELRNCGADRRCIAARLANRDIDYAALMVVNLSRSPALLTMRLVRTEGEHVVAVSSLDVVQDPRSIKSAMENELARMIAAAGHRLYGRLVIDVVPADAELRFEPPVQQWGVVKNVFVLEPRVYEITASRDGYVETSSRTVIQGEVERRLYLKLVESESLTDSPWFWIVLSTAVTAAAVAGVALSQSPKERFVLCPTHDLMRCGEIAE